MPRFTINGTEFLFVWDLAGNYSPEETFLVDQSRAIARFRIAYNVRHEFIETVCGFSYVKRVAGKNVLFRTPPWEYPSHVGLYCVGSPRNEGLTPYGTVPPKSYTIPVPVFPSGADLTVTLPSSGQPDFADSRVTLLFTTLPYKTLADFAVIATTGPLAGLPDEGDALRRGIKRYITRTGKAAGKIITIPGAFLFYENTRVPIPGSSGSFFQPAVDLTYTWYNIPEEALPFKAWNEVPGGLNATTFDGWPAETLLCQQPTFRETVAPFGQHRFNVTYTFRFLPNWFDNGSTAAARGHNWYPRVAPNDYTPASLRGKLIFSKAVTRGPNNLFNLIGATGDPPYRLVDFTKLFRPDQP